MIPILPKAKRTRLAIIAGHPVQYVAPWLTQLGSMDALEVHVFYLWDFGVVQTKDPGFGITLEWDIPLLEGYSHSFVQNLSADPGNHHFNGYINPTLAKEVAAWKPDVILLMNYAFRTYFRFLLDPRIWPIPIIFRGDSHDVGRRGGFKTKLTRMMRRIIFSRFALFLDVGKNNRDYLLASAVSPSKMIRAPHAIDNQRFQEAKERAEQEGILLRRRLGVAEDDVLICFVGKLIPIKRPFDLLEAFTTLPDNRLRKAKLLFVGEGGLKSSLRAASQPLDSVLFLDFQNQSNLPGVYAASDLIVLPSQSETWGLVINEAMNLSCPAVVSDHVGCAPDLVIPDFTGWVYPTGNVAQLRASLAQAIGNPAKLKWMGQNAAELIQDFSFQALTSALLTAVDRVTRRSGDYPPSNREKSPRIAA
ncbi:MAG: glycosyltransferase family 4 protein [Cyanobium sp.]